MWSLDIVAGSSGEIMYILLFDKFVEMVEYFDNEYGDCENFRDGNRLVVIDNSL